MLAIVFSLMEFKPRVSSTLIQRPTLDLQEGHWTTLQISCGMSSLYICPKDHVAITISQGDLGGNIIFFRTLECQPWDITNVWVIRKSLQFKDRSQGWCLNQIQLHSGLNRNSNPSHFSLTNRLNVIES